MGWKRNQNKYEGHQLEDNISNQIRQVESLSLAYFGVCLNQAKIFSREFKCQNMGIKAILTSDWEILATHRHPKFSSRH